MRQFTCPKGVTHPSTNRARCRATALIETNALPLHQTANWPTDAARWPTPQNVLWPPSWKLCLGGRSSRHSHRAGAYCGSPITDRSPCLVPSCKIPPSGRAPLVHPFPMVGKIESRFGLNPKFSVLAIPLIENLVIRFLNCTISDVIIFELLRCDELVDLT